MTRILHLSDLHLTGNVVFYVPPAISGFAAAEIDALQQLETVAGVTVMQPNVHCLVSGDLSAKGEAAELTVALTYLQQKLQLTRGMACGLGYKDGSFDTVLGNHDVWGGQSSLMSWFASYRKKQQALQFINSKFPVRWQCSNGSTYHDVGRIRVRTYLLDSTLPGLRNLFARGRIPQNQLDDLARMVKLDAQTDRNDRIENCLRIAVFHHPIHSIEGHRITMILERSKEVLLRLQKCGFGMVLCGHEHKQSIDRLAQAPAFFQCIGGSATQTVKSRDPNYFVVYNIQDDASQPNPTCRVVAEIYERSGVKGSKFSRSRIETFLPALAVI